MPHKFITNGKLTTEEFKVDLAMMSTKYRWELSNEIEEDLGEEEITITEEEKKDLERIEAMGRSIVNHHNKTFDMGNRKATDLPNLNSIKLLGPLPVSNEAELALRQDTFRQIFKHYVEETCLPSGEQETNLTSSQRNGLKSLKRRMKQG